jgi:hypothetical protein
LANVAEIKTAINISAHLVGQQSISKTKKKIMLKARTGELTIQRELTPKSWNGNTPIKKELTS